jgi:DNA sulfur modification protein DndC
MVTISMATIEELTGRIRELYLEDQIPWVVGYSGGKDSTATLQLVWQALDGLKGEERQHKPVHVISTDTLVESPVVAAWVNRSLMKIQAAACERDLSFLAHRLIPRVADTFWVNLIGNGYPAPRHKFRWCTSRLKIAPSNDFIKSMISKHGEAIVVLGTRSAESASRAATMKNYERQGTREWLSKNGSLDNSYVFPPIADWTNDDVWFYLMQIPNPWGHSNKELLSLYRGASADGECPLVLDTSTPSCGSSRFGCWVCTMVDEDKSMQAMIINDESKAWMMPLLELRNEIGNLDDRERRDFRRMTGRIMIFNGRAVHGPYKKEWRQYWLKRLLEVEKTIHEIAPPEFSDITLITEEELNEIRRIWLMEKHEFEDTLPQLVESVRGKPFVRQDDFFNKIFGRDEWELLQELCGNDPLYLELQSSLLDTEQHAVAFALRRGILDELETLIRRCYYKGEDDAVNLSSLRNKRKLNLEKDLKERLLERAEA